MATESRVNGKDWFSGRAAWIDPVLLRSAVHKPRHQDEPSHRSLRYVPRLQYPRTLSRLSRGSGDPASLLRALYDALRRP